MSMQLDKIFIESFLYHTLSQVGKISLLKSGLLIL